MSYVTIANHGPLAGDFVLRGKSDVSLGTYLEIVSTGPLAIKVAPFAGVTGCAFTSFPLVIRHSLIHDGANVESVFSTASVNVARFLSGRLKEGQAHTMRTVQYMHREWTWHWPGVDEWEMGLAGATRRPAKS